MKPQFPLLPIFPPTAMLYTAVTGVRAGGVGGHGAPIYQGEGDLQVRGGSLRLVKASSSLSFSDIYREGDVLYQDVGSPVVLVVDVG